MLIKLIPSGLDQPTVLFTLQWPSLPPQLPFPPAWSVQLQNLTADDLELPTSIHALDQAASASSLVHDVTFNVPLQLVQVTYVDELTQEWPMLSGSMSMFNSIVKDVADSAIQTEIEAEAELAQERARNPLPSPPPSPPVPVVKPTKHKKQRSLLMSLVASLTSSSSSLASSSTPLPSIPASPPPVEPKPRRTITRGLYEPELSARALRRRARSTLVDAFRLYVATEISSRAIPGGYYAWAAQSMMRRTTEHMSYLVQEAAKAHNARITESEQADDTLPSRHTMFSPTPMDEASARSFPINSSQEDVSTDGDSLCTDTDGSSLHTPTSSQWHSFTGSSPPYFASSHHQKSSSGSRSMNPHMSLEDHRLYTTLQQHTLRLRHLISIAASNVAHNADETVHRAHVLEIRSRRRAWLNKAFVGGSSVCGMAAPFEASGLGRWSWGPEEFFAQEDESDDTLVGEIAVKDEYELWPVSEGEESEEELVDREEDACLLRDLQFDADEVTSCEKPKTRARARTFTFEMESTDGAPPSKPRPRARTLAVALDPSTMDSIKVVSQSLEKMSLLSQPLMPLPGYIQEEAHHDQAEFIGADPFAEANAEFTLSMDAPAFGKRLRALECR